MTVDNEEWSEFEKKINDTEKMKDFSETFEPHFGMDNCLLSAKDVTEFVYHTKNESATGLISNLLYLSLCKILKVKTIGFLTSSDLKRPWLTLNDLLLE